ncbi:MAG TPA: hypothetical protein VIC58_05080, partial [Actinomycetota bacterium]
VGFVLLFAVSSPAASASPVAMHHGSVLAQTSPTTESPTPSPTPTPTPTGGSRSGLTTGAGIAIAAILLGGLLLMRTRLLRR